MGLNREDLIEFEAEVARRFNAGLIRAPVHLSDGNEDELIGIFDRVGREDWICCSWRSHYHCLLKGVPPDELMAKIMAGESIALQFPEYRVVSSAIVGGVLPIAVGLGLGLQRAKSDAWVWCFVGDMTARGGAFHEAIEYVKGHHLRVNFIVEDNGLSVCTDTASAWGANPWSVVHLSYRYKSRYPHAGAGTRVQF